MKRIMAAAVAALVIGGGIGVMATSHFTDVPSDHPNRADIGTVAGWGGYSGYPDGTFRPDRRITAEQMATVLGRVFPDGMTRGEFASFMVGGKARKESTAAVTTTTTPPSSYHYSATYWPEWTCANLWERIKGLDWSYENDPEIYTPGRDRFVNRVEIIFVEDWYKRVVTQTYFQCQGTAVLENAQQVAIAIVVSPERDGTYWYNYAFPLSPTLSCVEAKTVGWELHTYNLAFLYQGQRDGDSDRIMCEDTLVDTGRVRVGDVPSDQVAL